MITTIQFALPKEATDLQLALDAGKWRSVTVSLDQWLRNKKKHEDQNQIDIGDVRDYIGELMRQENLNFD